MLLPTGPTVNACDDSGALAISVPVWRQDDLIRLLVAFARLTDLQRTTVANTVWTEMAAAIREFGYTEAPPRSVNPLPYLAAEVTQIFLDTALGQGIRLADVLTDQEITVLKLWGESGTLLAPSPIAPAHEDSVAARDAAVRTWIANGAPRDDQAYTAAQLDTVTDGWEKVAAVNGLSLVPAEWEPPPLAPPEAEPPEPRVPPPSAPTERKSNPVSEESLTTTVGPELAVETVYQPALNGPSLTFTGTIIAGRQPVVGTVMFCPPEAIPISHELRRRATRAREAKDLGPTQEACATAEKVYLQLLRAAAGRPGVTEVVEVRISDLPRRENPEAGTARIAVQCDLPGNAGEILTLTALANATSVVVVAGCPADTGRLVDQLPAGGLPAADAARITAQVAAVLAVWHDLGFAHGLVNPGNVFVGIDGTVALGPPRLDQLRFEYDADGRLTQVMTDAGTTVCEYERNPDGSPARVYHYNQMGLVSAVFEADGSDASYYRYDAAGRYLDVAGATGDGEGRFVPSRLAFPTTLGSRQIAQRTELPAWVLADIRALGRLLYLLLTGTPIPGDHGEPMPCAAWDPANFPSGTPPTLLRVGQRCGSAPVADAYHFPEAAVLDLRLIADRVSNQLAGLAPGWNPAAPQGKDGVVMFDRFRIEKELGRGGFGVVYLAIDTFLGATVALKVFDPGSNDASSRASWQQEAKMLYSLQHPNIPRFEAVGEWRGRRYIATEWVRGETLATHAAKNRIDIGPGGPVSKLSLDWVARVVKLLAEAVQFAHTQGIVHRDLKPQNVILTPQMEVKLIDFGLAKTAIRTREADRWAGTGTPVYMAPEQLAADADQIGPRTDIWALGVILYELLTGRRPFPGESIDQVRQAVLDPEILPELPKKLRPELAVLDRGVRGEHPSLGRIALTCLKKDPAGRYKSAAEVVALIGRWLKSSRDWQSEATS